MGRGIGRKTKTRVENLIAWILAFGVVVLLGAGAWYVLLQLGVIAA